MRQQSRSRQEIDLEPLRAAFIDRGLRPADVARRLGWVTPKGYADGPRVKRALGLRPCPRRRPYPPLMAQRCSYDMAVRLVRAMGLDPVDFEL